MRQTLAIALREVAEKRSVVMVAVGFAALPFLLAILRPPSSAGSRQDLIIYTAGLLGVAFALTVAVVMGTNLISRDLAESRLSFYFSRPLSAAAIWFGKVGAALALIVVSFAIIIVPARLAGGMSWQRIWSGNGTLFALGTLALSAILFLAAHVIGSAVRSRSVWIAVDVAQLAVASMATFLILRPLLNAFATEAAALVSVVIGGGILVAMAGCGVWQLQRGRTDRVASHTALSQFLWPAVGTTLVLAAGIMWWIISAAPSDLVTLFPIAQGPGSWVVISGNARARMDYRPAFIYNADSGAYSPIPSWQLVDKLSFSSDGTTMLLSRRDFRIESGSHVDPRLKTVEIFRRTGLARGPGLAPFAEKSTGLTLPFHSTYTASADGSRIAAQSGGTLTVYDAEQRRALLSVRLPDSSARVSAMYFGSPTQLRVVTVSDVPSSRTPVPRTVRLYELDVTTRALRQTGELTREATSFLVNANQDGSRLAVRDSMNSVYVIDGRTAAVEATILASDLYGFTLLHDGGSALVRTFFSDQPAHPVVEIRDSAGAVLRSFELPVATAWQLRETSDHLLVTAARMEPLTKAGGWLTLIIDPRTGKTMQRIPGKPVGWTGDWQGYDSDPRRRPIELPHLFFGSTLFRWNYTTQTAEVLLPKR